MTKAQTSKRELIRQLLKTRLSRSEIATLTKCSYQTVRNVEQMQDHVDVDKFRKDPCNTPIWDMSVATESGLRIEVRLWEEKPIRLK